jgi:plastocyanin
MKALLALSLVLAGASSACSAEDPVADADGAVVNVRLSGVAFQPSVVRVKAGQVVRWTWSGGEHNVISGDNCSPDGAFRSGAPQAGGTFEKRFETAGTFPYYCEVHCAAGMKGEVIVE